MHYKLLDPEWELLSFCKIESGGYWIETQFTILWGIRVKLREVDDDSGYIIDWCAGNDPDNAHPLIFALLTAIEIKMNPRNLPSAEIRPWFNDEPFCKWIGEFFEKDYRFMLIGKEEMKDIRKYLDGQYTLLRGAEAVARYFKNEKQNES